eukprot:2602722-Amphidinium_carterae.1
MHTYVEVINVVVGPADTSLLWLPSNIHVNASICSTTRISCIANQAGRLFQYSQIVVPCSEDSCRSDSSGIICSPALLQYPWSLSRTTRSGCVLCYHEKREREM